MMIDIGQVVMKRMKGVKRINEGEKCQQETEMCIKRMTETFIKRMKC